jgi:hypothetical protein
MRLFLGMLLMVFAAMPAWAANKIYTTRETSKVFADTAQTPDVKLTWANLGVANGRISTVWDRGAGALSPTIHYRCTFQLTGTVTSGEPVELWLATSDDNTLLDGPITADSTITTRYVLNSLRYVASLRTSRDGAGASNQSMNYAGLIDNTPERYLYLVVWNGTSLPVRNDTSVNRCTLTPLPLEIQ